MRLRDLRNSTDWSRDAVRNIQTEESLLLKRQWTLFLQRTSAAGKQTREAILPCFNAWMNRRHGGASFRFTQILTGHGCFSSYLYRIGKDGSPSCKHCSSGVVDSAEHTLSECETWSVERTELREAIGNDLSMGAIVKAMSHSEKAWKAMTKYSVVMLTKKTAERERQAAEAARNAHLPDSGSPATDETKEADTSP